MTDRDALVQEFLAAVTQSTGTIVDDLRKCADIALRQIAAARAEALEEAALICQGRANGYSIYDTQMEAAQEAIICRNLIRALMDTPE